MRRCGGLRALGLSLERVQSVEQGSCLRPDAVVGGPLGEDPRDGPRRGELLRVCVQVGERQAVALSPGRERRSLLHVGDRLCRPARHAALQYAEPVPRVGELGVERHGLAQGCLLLRDQRAVLRGVGRLRGIVEHVGELVVREEGRRVTSRGALEVRASLGQAVLAQAQLCQGCVRRGRLGVERQRRRELRVGVLVVAQPLQEVAEGGVDLAFGHRCHGQ